MKVHFSSRSFFSFVLLLAVCALLLIDSIHQKQKENMIENIARRQEEERKIFLIYIGVDLLRKGEKYQRAAAAHVAAGELPSLLPSF